MKQADLIVMLTNKDLTVPESLQIFASAKDAPVDNWGFKNVGIPDNEMKKLASAMKDAGKTTFFEVLENEEKKSIQYAQFAVEMGLDYFLGLKYFHSVHEILKKGNIAYVPFIGEPRDGRLYGDIEAIVENAVRLQDLGVFGLNLSIFRYEGDYKLLITRVMESVNLPLCIAGSVNSHSRLNEIKSYKPWSFTIGGAFFDHVFGNSFTQQIISVNKCLKD